MNVTLENGDHLEIVGPVVTTTPDGTFVSHPQIRAKKDGEEVLADIDILHKASFPTEIE